MMRMADEMFAPLSRGGLLGGLGTLAGRGGGLGGGLIPDFGQMERGVERMMQQNLGMKGITLDIAEVRGSYCFRALPAAVALADSRTFAHAFTTSSFERRMLQKPESYEIHAELPGVPKENVRVDVDDETRVLTITAEKSVEKDVEAKPRGSHAQRGKKAQEQLASGAAPAGSKPADNAQIGAEGQVVATPEGAGTQGLAKKTEAAGGTGDVTTWHRTERYFGTITRSIALPADADADHITAKMDEGVLTLTIPKVKGEAEAKKQVKIE